MLVKQGPGMEKGSSPMEKVECVRQIFCDSANEEFSFSRVVYA